MHFKKSHPKQICKNVTKLLSNAMMHKYMNII